MTNKLAMAAKKASKKSPPKKDTPRSSGGPAHPVGTTLQPVHENRIAGLPASRYYEAEGAIGTLQRANEIRGDKKLHGDMRKVAQHKMNALKSVLGKGGK